MFKIQVQSRAPLSVQDKVAAIKAIRAITKGETYYMGLKEAKEDVEEMMRDQHVIKTYDILNPNLTFNEIMSTMTHVGFTVNFNDNKYHKQDNALSPIIQFGEITRKDQIKSIIHDALENDEYEVVIVLTRALRELF